MAWDDEPPDAKILAKSSNWDDEPPDPKILETTSKPKNDVSKLESLGRGAAQGASLGFGDEGSGILEYGIGKLMDKIKGTDVYDDASYSKLRDEHRKDNTSSREANPWVYGSGSLVGGLPSAIATGGATKAPAMIAAGTGMGGVTGLGMSEADTASGMAKDAGIGAGFGAAGASIAKLVSKFGPELVAKVAPGLAKKLGIGAEKMAVNATGATALEKADMKTGTGRYLLDEGQVGWLSSPRNIYNNSKTSMKSAGEGIESVLTSLDETGSTVDANAILSKIDDQIKDLSKNPSQASVVRQLEGYKDDILNAWIATAGKGFAPSEAEAIKKGYQQLAKNAYGELGRKESTKAAGYIFRESVEDLAEKVNPKAAEAFLKEKNTYGMLAPVAKAAKRRADVLDQSPLGGPGDLMMAAGGVLATGNPLGALAPLARRSLVPRLPSFLAKSLDASSRGASKLPGIVNQAAPMLNAPIQSGVRSQSQSVIENKKKQDQNIPIEKMGKFSSSLMKAKQRGPQALAVANYVLSNSNPEYREMLRQQKEQEEGEQYYG